MSDKIVNAFRDLYHNQAAPWTQVYWRGHQVAKCPMDLWIYQEILYKTKPDLIIEMGSNIGGSAFFFASILDMIGNGGRILTIDKDSYPNQPRHSKIDYRIGDSTDPKIADAVYAYLRNQPWLVRVMVVLDSLHTYDHVKKELDLYGHLVAEGCYLVVEDTAVDASWNKPAAYAALTEYLAVHPGKFLIDETCEKHLLTLNPGGWVKRLP